METEQQLTQTSSQKKAWLMPTAIVIAAAMISGTWLWTNRSTASRMATVDTAALEAVVLPVAGYELPVKWGALGFEMVAAGVIDRVKFDKLYEQRGGLNADEKALLEGVNNEHMRVNARNSGVLLNLLWALGLSNKNDILEHGPMMDKQYGGADRFASTGGWTISRGTVMDHYSHHTLITLTPEQQALVERVAKGIYRPCCGNSTYFPDCNHGMAMLGLLELMASQGVSEKDMYKAALAVNSYWFPDTYLTIAQYMQQKGTPWDKVDPRTMLGADYSSGAGYQRIQKEVAPQGQKGGGSCGV